MYRLSAIDIIFALVRNRRWALVSLATFSQAARRAPGTEYDSTLSSSPMNSGFTSMVIGFAVYPENTLQYSCGISTQAVPVVGTFPYHISIHSLMEMNT